LEFRAISSEEAQLSQHSRKRCEVTQTPQNVNRWLVAYVID